MAILFPAASTSLPTSKSSSSAVVPIFTNCPMRPPSLGPSFSQHLPACRTRPEFSSASISAPTARRAFHIPNRREQAVVDTSETADQPPIVRKDRTRTSDPRRCGERAYTMRKDQHPPMLVPLSPHVEIPL